MEISKLLNVIAIIVIAGTLMSCGTEYQPSSDDDGDQQPDNSDTTSTTLTPNEPVPADATLEAVTWNIEGYGTGFTGPGDDDEELQLKNIIRITDSLKADFYAFEEVADQQSLDNILDNMKGFRGFVADYIGQSLLRMAVAYNTNTIDSLTSGTIKDVTGISNSDWEDYWANGRTPLYFKFRYTFQGNSQEFYAVVLHGKANTGSQSEQAKAYERRKNAAEGLYQYLNTNKPDANIIMLGDYNDDLDESIYQKSDGSYPDTPYQDFVSDTQNYDVLSKKFSDAGESASVNYDDIIDHITISDELFDSYVKNSVQIYDAPLEYITSYGQTTSDHLPVWAKFDVTVSN